MSRRSGLFLLLAVGGLFLYLWPALRAPVVLWSDSALDLDWARRGVGIVSPIPPPAAGEAPPLHSGKPGYLLFLRVVLAFAPAGSAERTIVVVQSLLVWLSIVTTALYLQRRRGAAGILLLVVVFAFSRLRDMSSIVMPEALSAALLLPLVARTIELPRRRTSLLMFGLAIAVLFWVRPNEGGVALFLAVCAAVASRRWSGAAAIVVGFLVLFAPVWIATRQRGEGESLRGLAHAIVFGSADYYWIPDQGDVAKGRSRGELEKREIDTARANWNALLRGSGPDARRQLVWRMLHGLLGTEFYDPRWSTVYARFTVLSRVVTPFVTLAAIALILGVYLGRVDRGAGALGSLLVLALLAQNLLLISNPRFVLPFLPALYLLAATTAARLFTGAAQAPVLAGIFFAASLAFVATHPYVLDWEWGRIEAAGVKIRQRIPEGSFPRSEPATLHIRIAPPLFPSTAHLAVRSPEGQLLYSSTEDHAREKPVITVRLPRAVLEANSRGAIELELLSFGSYGELQYLLFPVIPRPWGSPARRDGGAELSPSTGIRSGSLDWWAHPGLP